MKIIELPDDERPREKLIARGAWFLSDAEVLAVLLGSGRSGRNAVETACVWLRNSGGLRELLEAPRGTHAIGTATWCRLHAAVELGRRCLNHHVDGTTDTPLTTPEMASRFFKSQLAGYPFEIFACLFLDNRHRIVSFEKMFSGTVAGASVHPREVVRRCVELNAAAVIFVHNHPSGQPEPSAADQAITARLRESLDLIEVRVLDHFIVGDGTPISMARRGML